MNFLRFRNVLGSFLIISLVTVATFGQYRILAGNLYDKLSQIRDKLITRKPLN
jgi:hypothetical protein